MECSGQSQEKLLLFIPAYNCARELKRVFAKLRQFDLSLFGEVLVIDNCSQDQTPNLAQVELNTLQNVKTTFIQNSKNLGFGGSHKVAFEYCLSKGFNYCLVLHGDDQANLSDFQAVISTKRYLHFDHIFGARFAWKSNRIGYAWHRTIGNFFFNALATLVLLRKVPDFGGSGLNIYNVRSLSNSDSRCFLKFSNDLTFHSYLLMLAIRNRQRICFIPINWHEDGQVSNARVIRQGVHLMKLLTRYALSRTWLSLSK